MPNEQYCIFLIVIGIPQENAYNPSIPDLHSQILKLIRRWPVFQPYMHTYQLCIQYNVHIATIYAYLHKYNHQVRPSSRKKLEGGQNKVL